jgi:hypothetical protein
MIVAAGRLGDRQKKLSRSTLPAGSRQSFAPKDSAWWKLDLATFSFL